MRQGTPVGCHDCAPQGGVHQDHCPEAAAQPKRAALTQEQAEALAHRRCRRYIHIDTVAPYQFDGHTLMDFLRDVLEQGIKGAES